MHDDVTSQLAVVVRKATTCVLAPAARRDTRAQLRPGEVRRLAEFAAAVREEALGTTAAPTFPEEVAHPSLHERVALERRCHRFAVEAMPFIILDLHRELWLEAPSHRLQGWQLSQEVTNRALLPHESTWHSYQHMLCWLPWICMCTGPVAE